MSREPTASSRARIRAIGRRAGRSEDSTGRADGDGRARSSGTRSGEGQPIASTGLYAILFPAACARFHDGSGVDAPCGPQNGRGAGGPERAIGYPEGKAYQKFQR